MRHWTLLGIPLLLAAVVVPTGCSDPPPPAVAPRATFVPPLQDAQEGEQLILARGEQEWRYTIIGAADTTVEVELVRYSEGVPLDRPERFTWHRNSFGVPDDAVVRAIQPKVLHQDGQRWDCWLLHVYTRDRGVFYYWLSDDVSAQGWLKIAQAKDGKPDEAHALKRVGDESPDR